MKFYIGSSFQNIDNVRYLSDKLKAISLRYTYDWTQNDRASTISQLKTIGQNEKNAVIESDFVVILLPGVRAAILNWG